MGQYYLIANLDKRQFISPHAFGDGAKLMEFGCSRATTLLGLAVLLADGNDRGSGDLHVPEGEDKNGRVGSWAGCRVVVAGDYADACKFVEPRDAEAFALHVKSNPEKYAHRNNNGSGTVHPTLLEVAELFYEDVSDDVRDLIALDDGCALCPSEGNFMKSTRWVVDQRTSRVAPRFNFTMLTSDDLRRVVYGATDNGPKYFAKYLRWLKKQPLAPSVRDGLTGLTFKKVKYCP